VYRGAIVYVKRVRCTALPSRQSELKPKRRNYGVEDSAGSEPARCCAFGEERMRMAKRAAAIAVLLGLLTAGANAQSIEDKAQICAACHGENGVPAEQSTAVPVIWGQNFGYLFAQLRDFRSGARKSDQMTAIAQALEPADLMPLAQFFSKKPWPDLERPAATQDIVGTVKRVNAGVVCTSCHLRDLKGDATTPRLAGQKEAYLHKIMVDFATGARSNNDGMTGFMRDLSAKDIAAMAAWLAGM
jgi:cytochrome c553